MRAPAQHRLDKKKGILMSGCLNRQQKAVHSQGSVIGNLCSCSQDFSRIPPFCTKREVLGMSTQEAAGILTHPAVTAAQAGAAAGSGCRDSPGSSPDTWQLQLLPTGDLHTHSWEHSRTAHSPHGELRVSLCVSAQQNHFSIHRFLERKINSER